MLRSSLVCCGLLLAAMWAAAFASPAEAESTKLKDLNTPATCEFFDDFSDGIWTKYHGNPVLTTSEESKGWDRRYICEPSLLFEDGIFKMWYKGDSRPGGRQGYDDARLGYATSRDGFTWEKYPNNPILTDPNEPVTQPIVMKHEDKYYLFASNYHGGDYSDTTSGDISRWSSKDGLHWGDKIIVLRPTESWEGAFNNMAVVVDSDGTWQMLYETKRCSLGYAYSSDGIHWTKYRDNPVISHSVCGDPCMRKVGNLYFTFYSVGYDGDAGICCTWSKDMIHWNPPLPQFGFTQPWERGWGRPEAHYNRLISDADVAEHNGKVFLCYQGAQNPFGIAVFEGTLKQLVERLLHSPPLSKWEESPYVSVENKELKISENATDKKPFVEKAAKFSDSKGYVFEFRGRCYAGASYQIKPVMRYINKKNYARFWIMNNDTTWYQECRNGQLGGTANIGANNICDSKWHDWKIVVKGADNTLYLDGRLIGKWQSNPVFVNRNDLRIGFGVFDTYAAFDDVKVTNSDLERSVAKWQDK